MRITWIDEPEKFVDFCAEIAGEVIAVDTESDHYQAYHAKVCLIQVGTAEQSALVDPLRLGAQGLAPLFELLEDPRSPILMHAGRNDIRELNRDFNIGVSNIFDTQVAAKFLGYERNGLTWLQRNIIGKKPPGQFQTYDWNTRPIPAPVREYAIADVIDLFALRERFLPELEETGWLAPFQQHCAYIASTSDYQPSEFDPAGWWKVLSKVGKRLDAQGRATLRELFIARHEICDQENRAAVHIFSNRALSVLATVKPKNIAALRKANVLSDEMISAYSEPILRAVDRARHAKLPGKKRPSMSKPRSDIATEARRRALIDWRNHNADRLGVPGMLIATNSTLSDIAADPPSTVKGLDAFIPILDWQREMFGEEILEILRRTA